MTRQREQQANRVRQIETNFHGSYLFLNVQSSCGCRNRNYPERNSEPYSVGESVLQ